MRGEFTAAKKRATSPVDFISEWDVVHRCCVPKKGPRVRKRERQTDVEGKE